MQREANVKLKEVIFSLCKLLAGLGVEAVPSPETFRRGKFNRRDGTADLWKLLYSLLKPLHPVCPCASNKANLALQVDFVKSVLLHYGYGVWESYQLPADGSEGSRELLLALSWLFHRINLLEQLLYKTRLSLGDETTLCVGGTPLVEGSLGLSAVQAGGGSGARYLEWLQGRLRFHWRALHAAQEEKATLLYKIHTYTKGCHSNPSISHLSVAETSLIKSPQQQSRMLMLLECEITLLESYLEWKRLEPLYWHWMESVLDAKVADDSQEVLNANTVAMALGVKRKDKDSCQRNQSMKREMDRVGKELLELKWGLQGEASAKRASWCKRVEHKEQDIPLDPQEFGAIALKLHDRVGQKLSALRCNNVKPATNTAYRLLLRETTKQKTLTVHAGETEASQVIKELKEMESDLLSELTKLRSDCKDEMLEMMAGVDGMIFIPPLKR
ncbi:tubulin epsilon and delta complex protein 1 isoform X1 [Acipenser oxyrinchus oxyrinchus]|uniref:Tubulin epsilon and delta complex protein 1 isoform X1 n=1 Tax=Acipenser oxyrinchus oxyrinchus TaxID=40147 RepID=A0AAD8D0S8_ACIOX|nr:tubulin epsilon and delta complex protein 1 isoform X1 [Acipenser oxyrinchus oxyrinchus]